LFIRNNSNCCSFNSKYNCWVSITSTSFCWFKLEMLLRLQL
jgi:hypothetical protein